VDSAVGLELADSAFQDNKGLRSSSSLRNSHLSGLHTQNPPDSENLQNGSLSSGNALGLTTSSLVEIVDRLIEKGTTIAGQINVSVAGIDLIVLDLLATLQPVRNMLENNDTKRRKSSSRRGSKDGRKNKREKRI
jgi:hypothetical protein